MGTLSDQIWLRQEELGEASEYVIPVHEFKLHSNRLNTDGEDHVKRLAQRLNELPEMPVVIERTMNGNQLGKYNYPVNADPELDNQRREIVVQALIRLGVENADELVVVAPAFATPANGNEAEAAFYQAIGGSYQGSGFGGGFGGFGGGNLGGLNGGGVNGFGAGGVSSSTDTSSAASFTSSYSVIKNTVRKVLR